MFDLRKWENMHIPFWLVKDTCWMLEWKNIGVVMVIPTILIVFYILKKSIGHAEFYIHLAICFWISANSFWMCAEFFDFLEYKMLAGIPFAMGMIAVAIFYYKQYRNQLNSGH